MIQQSETGRLSAVNPNEIAFLQSLQTLHNAMLDEFVNRVKLLKKVYGINQTFMCGITVELPQETESMSFGVWSVEEK